MKPTPKTTIALTLAALTLCACGASTSSAGSMPAVATARTRAQHADWYPADGVAFPALADWARAQRTAEADRRAHRTVSGPNETARYAGRLFHVETLATRGSTAAKTLVLYDTAGDWGYLGELYAMAAANLAGHFGSVDAEPIQSYVAGQMQQYTATIYIGSTYYSSASSIPAAFYNDAFSTTKPLVWMNDNIWYFADAVGSAAFESKYGWDPTTSYFANASGSIGSVTQVLYKGQALTRSVPAGDDSGVLHPNILGAGYPSVTTLAVGEDISTSPSTPSPWAIQSGNLTYIGEIPFDYVTETDRIIAFEDMLFNYLAPGTAIRHRALVRLEDLNPSDNPNQDMQAAQYLYDNKIPFSFGVIGIYTDPLGYYNNGVPKTMTWAQTPAMVKVIKYMLSHGGTMVAHGYTHQYSNVDNPYSGVTADDAEFFLASVNSGDYVVWNGPVPGDSTSWAAGRAASAIQQYQAAGLPTPGIWETPHYFATSLDYAGFARYFPERYERSLYFSGTLLGNTNFNVYMGQFFPYVVADVYGTKVLPEDCGAYSPLPSNNNPPWLPANMIQCAQDNLAVRDGFASFFYHPYQGLPALEQTVQGIRALGYEFVSASSL